MAVVTVAFSDLAQWLQTHRTNTVDTPYELNITGLTANNLDDARNVGTLGFVIDNFGSNKYVDLSYTYLPEGITELRGTFYSCGTLVKAPVIPNGVTDMTRAFYDCANLKEAPIIPNTVESLAYTFQDCVWMKKAPIIPNGVINMDKTFYDCLSLNFKPILPSSVITSTDCYYYVTQTKWGDSLERLASWIPAQTSEFEVWEIEADTDNNCYKPTGRKVYGIDISNLSTWLQNADENTVDTPYEIKVLGMTTSDYGIGIRLANNPTKFVDLRYTELPSGITSLLALYQGCVSLVYAPQIPNGVTTLEYAFMQCSNLKQVPTIPNTVTLMTMAFADCQNITVAPTIPSGVTTMIRSFIRTGITATPSLPNTITSMEGMFIECTALTTITNIPTACEVMYEAFRGCTALTTIPAIPEGVENLYQAFEGCSNIVTVPLIPSTVNRANMCFKNCTSLTKITEFKVPLNTLKNNANFQNMFQGCSALTEIGYVIKEDDWHVWRLKYGSNTVEGKIFSADGSYVTINEGTAVSITKSDLQLPILTDELWFPNESDNDIDTTILKMLQYRYGVFKKETIPPDEKTMVLWADDAEHFKTNLPIQPVDEVTVGNMHSVSSNAVAQALGKTHYYHTTFTGTNENGWQTITIAFDVLYKYPPLVSVTTSAQAIQHPYEYYWRETVSPFYIVTEGGITIAYYVRDSTPYSYDINVFGVLPD